MTSYRVGLDIGSTTAKIVVLDNSDKVVFSKYARHNANVVETIKRYFDEMKESLGECGISLIMTGSVGMGLADYLEASFVQEVIAATEYSKRMHPEITTMIDIGGEDAKVVFFREGGMADLRMNGNCAGGTGAFIDQMAIILGVDVSDMDKLASQAKNIYPIASRCGVFSKTDIQTLLANNISKADASASIFHAVAVQTISTLAKGNDMTPKILLCGGPLNFIPSLRKAFFDYLKLDESDFVVPKDANLIPAYGAALYSDMSASTSLDEIVNRLDIGYIPITNDSLALPQIFVSETEHERWKKEKQANDITYIDPRDYDGPAYIGIDSGSTTTKIVLIDEHDRILFSFYCQNDGNPIEAAGKGIQEMYATFANVGKIPDIQGSCTTGYGEDLIKAAYNLDYGIIETIAHYISAKRIDPDVSFILDIGGQDMKAIFIENGILTRMEINEACSSGCGTFIETFAKSLNHTVPEFAEMACLAKHPSDLGTRCTVFMNSKVKQALREGASIDDIAAGLSYSVIKNCLFKVLKFKNVSELGPHIVVQGGTMKNDSVVRALEKLVGQDVFRSGNPELMGALGCALYAKEHAQGQDARSTFINITEYTTKQTRCHGCENQCYVNKYTFSNNNIFYSGNKCEKIFTNRGESAKQGRNAYTTKYELLFNRKSTVKKGIIIGIPRSLNMYEDYPFWHTLFEECGIHTILSGPSSYAKYEQGVHTVMSDNICFPAKLLHSHIYELMEKGADRIFFPFVVYEKREGGSTTNTYNCPVVTGYSEIIKSAIVPDIPVDNPVISFKEKAVLEKQCVSYMKTLGVNAATSKKAVKKALEAQHDYETSMTQLDKEILEDSVRNNRLTILLAGRPYHTDPLVQHKISDMIAAMGINVINEDIVRFDDNVTMDETYLVSQWAYINRILKAAKWVARQGNNVHYIQMTSFGCGPDAFLLDEVKGVLNRSGKALTILKIDDINNIGSLKLRVRSVVESIKYNNANDTRQKEFHATKIYEKEDRPRKIIAPFFTDYISPIMASCFKLAGYDVEILPESNQESAETGLIYTNNEVCYPAILVVGDLIKALQSGRYDLKNTAVAMSQTGGQCRATNYLALIKKAMVEAGFKDIPVISFAIGDGLINEQPGFGINWVKMLPIALTSILYTDTISKFYHASIVREKEEGQALQLRKKYLDKANEAILSNNTSELYPLLDEAAEEYNSIIQPGLSFPKVGIVGEIYLKFNGFAHKRVTQWFIDHKFEVVPPQLLDFFTQSFVNRKVRNNDDFKKAPLYDTLFNIGYKLIRSQLKKVDTIASKFKYHTPFNDIFDEAEHGKEILSLSVQFGEGWLLPAEIVSFAKSGVNNVVSLQPFGCIANHIISRGMEKKIKTLFPKMNLLSLDFDSGVSETNVINRLLLFSNNIK